jgi:putative tryptophan/tyrosine transport system substrate-binding protein
MLLAGPPAEAQQAKKVPRIGYLSGVDAVTHSNRSEPFRQAMHELGYIEGRNLVIEYRYAEGKLDRLPKLAAELVRLKVDVIVSTAPPPTRAAKAATASIPIVMAFDDDPVGNGFVVSLARPGGNITGLSSLSADVSGKQLELLKEVVPGLTRVAVLGTSSIPQYAQLAKEIERAANGLGVRVLYMDVLTAKDIEAVFRAATNERAEAMMVLGSPFLNSHRKQITELAIKNRLPATYSRPDYVEVGGLMTYAASIADLFRRAAVYVDKILKGTKPGDIPIEQPTKFEFIVNLKAAKQIGLTIPPNVLARADRVIR